MRASLALMASSLVVFGCEAGDGWTLLRSLDDLEVAFNADRGKARIVLLLSPT